jgi:hypothetical protein
MQTRTAAALHSSRSPSPRSARIGQLVTLRGAEGVVVVVVVAAGPVPAVCFCFLIAAGFAALSGGDARQGGLRVQHRPPRVQHDGRLPVDFGALAPSEYLRVPVVLRCKTRVNCRVALEVMRALCAAARAWRLTGILNRLRACRLQLQANFAVADRTLRSTARPMPHLRRDWARPFLPTSAPGLGSPLPSHICTGTGLAPCHICTGTELTPSHICTGTGLTPFHICNGTRLTPFHIYTGTTNSARPLRAAA